MRIPACHRLTNRCDQWPVRRFIKWMHQIFYTLFSAIVGFLLGASDGLGEIHSVDAVHELFEQFPEAFMRYLHVPTKESSFYASNQVS
ncbi:callose synthase 9-like [Nymphaea colorata]|uniref:callose synthase 9-like n=1 Tax=Nymphaea colorata TaxID=210225 RepID=UPI00214E011F|nr:callose synthase 9-like [Nymphaea colorata]